jgi:hypothetical protein
MTKDEALDLALETLESIQAAYPCETVGKRITAIKQARSAPEEPVYHLRQFGDVTKEQLDRYMATGDINPQPAPVQEPVLQDIEQYRLQMAGISTAAIGYWKEGDGIHPDYDTPALRDVAKLYAKYDALYTAAQRPMAEPHKWVGLTDEEVDECYESVMFNHDIEPTRVLVYQAIEAKLRSKNT